MKYNLKDGRIIIKLALQKKDENYFFITNIEDSGKGIEEERIISFQTIGLIQ